MKIFVVSWFYPPVTTSEALVTYKLFSNSKHEYYVISASSNKWSYNSKSPLESANIKHFIVETEEFDVFVDAAVKQYEELSKDVKFDAIMTRAMPPESNLAGFKIKEKHPEIPWIASLADPIGNNPYETLDLVYHRRKLVRRLYYNAPNFFIKHVARYSKNPYTKKLESLLRLEEKTVAAADVVIVPTEDQGIYISRDRALFDRKFLVVPHSFDRKLYPKVEPRSDGKFVFSFVGHSDKLRSLEPVVRAVKTIQDYNREMFEKIEVRFVGNVPSEIRNMIYVFFLQDKIKLIGSVDYTESLRVMQDSDVLIHVDASFPTLPNGCIFFAAKVADYLGAGHPILGITDKKCPAGRIITETGGKVSIPFHIDLAKEMLDMMYDKPSLNVEAAEKYNAVNVAKEYDAEIERRLKDAR